MENEIKSVKVNSVKVNCSFCGKEIECPEDMLEESEKHMCFECFQNMDSKHPSEDMSKVHIDIPMDKLLDDVMPNVMTNQIVEEIFPEIWKENKERLKQLSKKKLAEEMFGEGAFTAIDMFLQMVKKEMEEKK